MNLKSVCLVSFGSLNVNFNVCGKLPELRTRQGRIGLSEILRFACVVCALLKYGL